MKSKHWLTAYRRETAYCIELWQLCNTGGMFDKDLIEANAVLLFIDEMLED